MIRLSTARRHLPSRVFLLHKNRDQITKATSDHLNFRRIRTAKRLKWPQCSIPSDFSLYSIIQTISISRNISQSQLSHISKSHSQYQSLFSLLSISTLKSLYSQSQSPLSALNLKFLVSTLNLSLHTLHLHGYTPFQTIVGCHLITIPQSRAHGFASLSTMG